MLIHQYTCATAHLLPICSDGFGDVVKSIRFDEADEFGVDVVGEDRTLVNEAGVDLYEAGSGADTPVGFGGAADSSDADEQRLIVELFGDGTEEFKRFFFERCSADATDRLGVLDEGIIHGGVGRDDASAPGIDGGLTQSDRLFRLHVGCDLEEDGAVGDLAADAEDFLNETLILQVTQAGSIGGGDVDDDVGAILSKGAEESLVVFERIVLWGDFVFADVDPDGVVEKAELFEALDHVPGAFVVEPHGVLDRIFVDVAKQARLGIAWLRFGRDGTDLGKAKSECRHDPDIIPVFVKSGSQSHRIGKRSVKNLLTEHGVIDVELV